MPRDNNGQYTLPNPAFQPQTIIKSQEVNGNFGDIATALTLSLSRQGTGGMQGPLGLQDGSAAAPSLTFNAEPTLGLYRGGASNLRLVAGGATLEEWALTYVNINRPLTVAPPTQNSTAITATGNGTGNGGVFTGGTPTGNVASGVGVIATGGAVSGSGGGAPGLRATGTGTSVAAEFNGGIRVNTSPLGPGAQTSTVYGVLADVVMLPTGDYSPACLARALIPTQTYKNELNVRVKSKVGSAMLFSDVAIGLSGDVTGSIGLLGQFMFDADAPMISRSLSSPAASNNSNAALALTNGGLRLDGVAPARATAVKNTAVAPLLPKAWVRVSITSGATPVITIEDGANVSNVLFNVVNGTNGQLVIFFAQAFLTGANAWTYTVDRRGTVNRYFAWEASFSGGLLTVYIERIQNGASNLGYQTVDFTNVTAPTGAIAGQPNDMTLTFTVTGRQ